MGFPKGASIPFGQGNPAREVASFILPDRASASAYGNCRSGQADMELVVLSRKSIF